MVVRRRQNKGSPSEIDLIEVNYFMRWNTVTRKDLFLVIHWCINRTFS